MTARNITTKRRWSHIMNPAGQLLEIPPDDTLARIVLPDEVDPYAESATQQFPLGTKLICWGGEEVYRYALEGGAGVEIGASTGRTFEVSFATMSISYLIPLFFTIFSLV